MGWNGRLRIEPNPAKVEGDDRSPDFIAFLEENAQQQQQQTQTYKGPQLTAPAPQPRITTARPAALPAYGDRAVEGEIVDPFRD